MNTLLIISDIVTFVLLVVTRIQMNNRREKADKALRALYHQDRTTDSAAYSQFARRIYALEHPPKFKINAYVSFTSGTAALTGYIMSYESKPYYNQGQTDYTNHIHYTIAVKQECAPDIIYKDIFEYYVSAATPPPTC